MWVVVNIVVPFWVCSIIRHLVFRGPKEGTMILTTTHILQVRVCRWRLAGLQGDPCGPICRKPLSVDPWKPASKPRRPTLRLPESVARGALGQDRLWPMSREAGGPQQKLWEAGEMMFPNDTAAQMSYGSSFGFAECNYVFLGNDMSVRMLVATECIP